MNISSERENSGENLQDVPEKKALSQTYKLLNLGDHRGVREKKPLPASGRKLANPDVEKDIWRVATFGCVEEVHKHQPYIGTLKYEYPNESPANTLICA